MQLATRNRRPRAPHNHPIARLTSRTSIIGVREVLDQTGTRSAACSSPQCNPCCEDLRSMRRQIFNAPISRWTSHGRRRPGSSFAAVPAEGDCHYLSPRRCGEGGSYGRARLETPWHGCDVRKVNSLDRSRRGERHFSSDGFLRLSDLMQPDGFDQALSVNRHLNIRRASIFLLRNALRLSSSWCFVWLDSW